MSADTVLAELLEAGIEPDLTPDETGIIFPAGVLTDAQRAAIKACKSDLIDRIRESARLTTELLQAAMRCCDHHRDGPDAREQMRLDCLGTPLHQRADLLDYFQGAYPGPRHERT